MAAKHYYILLIAFLLGTINTYAQVPDSVVVTSHYYKTFSEDDIFNNYSTRTQALDTFVTDFHIYNPVIRKYNMNTTLGNLGLPARNPFGTPYRNMGFDLGQSQLSAWELTKQNVTYYRSRAPFIEATYYNGSKKEQLFSLNLNQNITKTWNMGLSFQRLNSPGFYLRQNADNTYWMLYTSYESKNGKYRLAFNGERNNLLARQNGGVKDLSAFTNNTESNRQLLDVNLTGAINNQKTRYAHFQQSFDLKRWDSKYTNKLDTVQLPTQNAVRLYHVFDIAAKALMHNDTAYSVDSFYVNVNFDSLQTHDRTNNTVVENRVGLKLISEKDRREPRLFDVYAGHQFIKYHTFTDSMPAGAAIAGTSNNLYVGGNVKLPVFKGWGLNGSATIFLAGYNIGDYEGRFSVSSAERDTLGNIRSRLEAGIMVKAYQPTYMQSNYTSNNFIWSNDFKKTFANTLFARYTNVKLKVEASAWLNDMRQYIYYDETGRPAQASTGVTVFAAQIAKRFVAGNKWHFDGYLTGQYVTSKLLPLPNVVLRTSLYYQNYVFKKALLLATGIDVFYNTAYYAPRYMAATGQFYIQNQVKVGNYPYVDVFLDAQIKKARIFFKIEHVTSGLFGRGYLQYPNFPMNDRAFKLGINWRFFN